MLTKSGQKNRPISSRFENGFALFYNAAAFS